MFVQDSLLEHKDKHDTSDELDDTLSLCDLPLYGEQSVEEWEEDLSIESQGSTSMSSSDDHDDYFEFFSHELVHSTNTCFSQENIIFCGKIIPCKQPLPSKEANTKQPTGPKKGRDWSLFRWGLGFKTKNNKGTTTQASKNKYKSNKQGKGYDLVMHKMPILTSSPSGKARWFLFLTGISRFSSKMELRDMKSRQSRRHDPTTMPSSHDEVASKGLWEVVRVLSCGGNLDPSAMVVGSINCNRVEGR